MKKIQNICDEIPLPGEILKLKWSKARLVLINTRRTNKKPVYLCTILEQTIKTITREDERNNITYHLKKHYFKKSPGLNKPIHLEILFFNQDQLYIINWLNKFLDTIFNFNVLDIHGNRINHLLADQNGSHIIEQCTTGEILKQVNISSYTEMCLKFYTPLYYNVTKFKKEGKSFGFISAEAFFRLLENRINKIFGIKIRIPVSEIEILPYYWNYDVIKRESGSEPGRIQLIEGFTGKLFVKGTIKKVLPYLLLGSQFHITQKNAFGYGYFEIEEKPCPFFDIHLFKPSEIKKSIEMAIEKYDSVDDLLSAKSSGISAEGLSGKMRSTDYTPEANTAYKIKGDGKSRFIEIVPPVELLIQYHLFRIIQPNIDRMFEEESFGFRRGKSIESAIAQIRKAVNEGYEYVYETDIEDFFPSIDHSILQEKIYKYFPLADEITKRLIIEYIKTDYKYNGKYYKRNKGLPLGSPLSPLLANFYLDEFDEIMKVQDLRLIRFADDMVIMCKSEEDARAVEILLDDTLERLSLKKNQSKTSIKHISNGLNFLGYEIFPEGAEKINLPTLRSYKKPLYITEAFVILQLLDETILLKKEGKILGRYPLRRLSAVILMEKATLTSGIFSKCVEMLIPVTITLNNGYFITTIKPDSKKFFSMSSAHSAHYDQLSFTDQLHIAGRIVVTKILNFIYIFKQRYQKGSNELFNKLYHCTESVKVAGSLEEIRGYEGKAARDIYKAMNSYIVQDEFKFVKRDRFRNDPINSLLNFGYYLLFSNINATLRQIGLNPYLGILHSSGDRYESLVADIEELFRAKVVQLILRLINLKIIKHTDFVLSGERLYLNSNARKIFITEFELMMEHPDRGALRKAIVAQCENIRDWVHGEEQLYYYRLDFKI